LGHLAVLCLPTPPPLICFEEPENYLHPRLLELLVELFRNAAEKTQVFVTTHSCAFSPDGHLLASGSTDRGVHLWAVAQRQEVAVLSGHAGSVWVVAFRPDGKILASGSSDQTVRLWDAEQRTETAILQGHTGEVNAVAFSPDGRLFASGSNDGTVLLWGTTSTDVEEANSITSVLSPISMPSTLFQNYPNPFNPETVIRYVLPKAEEVVLVVYDVMGRRVWTLMEGQQGKGVHTVMWEGKDEEGQQVASGIYVYRLQVGGEVVQTRRMVLIR
jgi:WD40 repeat protein